MENTKDYTDYWVCEEDGRLYLYVFNKIEGKDRCIFAKTGYENSYRLLSCDMARLDNGFCSDLSGGVDDPQTEWMKNDRQNSQMKRIADGEKGKHVLIVSDMGDAGKREFLHMLVDIVYTIVRNGANEEWLKYEIYQWLETRDILSGDVDKVASEWLDYYHNTIIG